MARPYIEVLAAKGIASPTLLDRIKEGLIVQAAQRMDYITANPADPMTDGNERGIITAVLDGSYPPSWATDVISALGAANVNLSAVTTTNPTDAVIDSGIDTTWTYLIKSRP
jgi:hypothetical protein